MSLPAERRILRFGEFRLDPAAYELRRNGEPVRLARQPMELLLLLLERRGEMVTRDELAGRLWTDGVFVDQHAGIHTAILKIRKALGDRESRMFVETVPGKGYRFATPVELDGPPLGTSSDAPPAVARTAASPRRTNLPAELTSFVGRREALAELQPLLSRSRLLSLTGAGGVGKTRLAIRIASAASDDYPHGAWLVDVAPLGQPELVPEAVASALGVWERIGRSMRDALVENLRQRELLLVLDTCEHLIEPCAELVESLLREAPGLRILATSREPLGVPGEVVYRVPSLAMPGTPESMTADALGQYDATRLFLDRATRIESGFAVTDRDAVAIARICQRLDGIPLAIELAAARVVMLSPEQIEARLQDRFRLLTGGARTAVPRQRTLEATVEWSYQLLSPVERTLFDRLSVFPASWTLASVEQVCAGDGLEPGETLDVLSRLASKSLVVPDAVSVGERRYRFLETVRQYARERLLEQGQADRRRDRHFAFVWSTFRGALTVLRGLGQVECLRRLDREQENIRAALEWGLNSPPLVPNAVELAGALFWFWTKRGFFEEGRRWLERAVAVEAAPALRARALIGLAHMYDFQGKHAAAAESARAAFEVGRQAGDPWAVSVSLFLQSLTAFELGDHKLARVRALEARDAADRGCGPVEHGGPLMILGNLALMQGEHDRAQQLFDESIEVHRRAGDSWGLSILLSIAAGLCVVRQDFSRARLYGLEALSLSETLEDPRGLAWGLEVCAGLLAADGQAEEAARLWGASDQLLERGGGMLLPTIGWIRTRYLDDVRTSLGEAVFGRVRSEGRDIPPDRAIALARDHANRFA